MTHGVSGLHFRVGSASDLSVCLGQAATQPALWERLCAAVPRPPRIDETVESLLKIYRSARGGGADVAAAVSAVAATGQPSRSPV